MTGGSQETEIIDMKDPSFKCTKPKQFPENWYTADGGLVGQVPFVCNGGHYDTGCYALQQSGSWQKDPYATRRAGEVNTAIGSVVLHNKLVIAGGALYPNNLHTIQVASPNTRTTTLSVRLPVGTSSSCIVPWDDDTFMLIGGLGNSNTATTSTYFVNIKTNRLTYGPSLLTARYNHACNEVIVNGESFIIVAGGRGVNWSLGAFASTEYLSKSSTENKWKTGKVLILRKDLQTTRHNDYCESSGANHIYLFFV